MRHRYIWVSFCLLGLPSHAFAQDAGSLLRDRERAREADLPQTLPSDGDTSQSQPTPEPAQGETILIEAVVFAGQTSLLSDAEQARLAATIQGQQLDFAAIRSFTSQVDAALRRDGHLLAQAIVPPQDVTNGTLTVEIREGSLEAVAFEFAESARIGESILAGIFDHWVDRDQLNERDLETALLRMSDLPGVSARSRLASGTAPGTTRLVVDVSEAPILSGALYGDNFGSPSTGEVQGHAQLAISDATGLGELTRLGFSYSDGQRYGSASIAVPLFPEGLQLGLSYSYLDYRNVDAIGAAAGLEGKAEFATASLDWQVIRTRNANLALSAALNNKSLVDEATAGRLSDKRIVSGSLGLAADVTDRLLGGGVTQVSLGWTVGELDLSALPNAELIDALSVRTQGTFHRLNADLLRLQRLGQGFTLLTRASGQWASKNLDSSESFSLVQFQAYADEQLLYML